MTTYAIYRNMPVFTLSGFPIYHKVLFRATPWAKAAWSDQLFEVVLERARRLGDFCIECRKRNTRPS